LTFEDCALIVLGSFIAAMAVFGIFYSLYVMVKK
jgi:ABC-type lipoprotein release transport system permease subunit